MERWEITIVTQTQQKMYSASPTTYVAIKHWQIAGLIPPVCAAERKSMACLDRNCLYVFKLSSFQYLFSVPSTQLRNAVSNQRAPLNPFSESS